MEIESYSHYSSEENEKEQTSFHFSGDYDENLEKYFNFKIQSEKPKFLLEKSEKITTFKPFPPQSLYLRKRKNQPALFLKKKHKKIKNFNYSITNYKRSKEP